MRRREFLLPFRCFHCILRGKSVLFYLPTFFELRTKAPETPALYVHKCRLSEHRVVFRAFPCQFLCPFSSPHLTGLYKQLYYPLFPWLAGRDLNCAQGRPRRIQRLRRHTDEIAKIYLHFPLLRSVSKENMYPADRPKHILFLYKETCPLRSLPSCPSNYRCAGAYL